MEIDWNIVLTLTILFFSTTDLLVTLKTRKRVEKLEDDMGKVKSACRIKG